MSDVRYYEIINPSDRVAIKSSNEAAAAVAVMLISGGNYGLRRDDGETVLPVLAFSGKEAAAAWVRDAWHIPNLGPGLDAFIDANASDMASALESVFYGRASEMKAFDLALEGLPDAAERRAKYNESRRSSMTNIGDAALAYAAKLRRLTP